MKSSEKSVKHRAVQPAGNDIDQAARNDIDQPQSKKQHINSCYSISHSATFTLPGCNIEGQT